MIKFKNIFSILLFIFVSTNVYSVCSTPVNDLGKLFSGLDRATNLCAKSDLIITSRNMVTNPKEFCNCISTVVLASNPKDQIRQASATMRRLKFKYRKNIISKENKKIMSIIKAIDPSIRNKACDKIKIKHTTPGALAGIQSSDKNYLKKVIRGLFDLKKKRHTPLAKKDVARFISKFNKSIKNGSRSIVDNSDRNSMYYKIFSYTKGSDNFLNNELANKLLVSINQNVKRSDLNSITFGSGKSESEKVYNSFRKKSLKSLSPIIYNKACSTIKKSRKNNKEESFVELMQDFHKIKNEKFKANFLSRLLNEMSFDNQVNFRIHYCKIKGLLTTKKLTPKFLSAEQALFNMSADIKSPTCESVSNQTQPTSGLNLRKECYKLEKGMASPSNELEELFSESLKNQSGFQRDKLNPYMIRLNLYIDQARKSKDSKNLNKALLIQKNLQLLKDFDSHNYNVRNYLSRISKPYSPSEVTRLRQYRIQFQSLVIRQSDLYDEREESSLDKVLVNKFYNVFDKINTQTSNRYTVIDDTLDEYDSNESTSSSKHKRARKTVTVDQSGSNSPGTVIVDKSALATNSASEVVAEKGSIEPVAAEVKVTEPKGNSTVASSDTTLPTQLDPSLAARQQESNSVIANIPDTTTYPNTSSTSDHITDSATTPATVQDNQDAAPKKNASVAPVKVDNPQETSTSEELERMREQIAELTAAKKETSETPVSTSRDGSPVVLGGGSSVGSSSSKGSSHIQDQPVQRPVPVINNQVQNTKVEDQHPPVQSSGKAGSSASDSAPLTLSETRYKPADITSDKTVVEFHITEEEFGQKTEQQKDEIVFAELEDAVFNNDIKEGDVIKIGNDLIPITKELIAQIKAKKLAKEKKLAEASSKSKDKKSRKSASKNKKVPTKEVPSVTTQQLLDAAQ